MPTITLHPMLHRGCECIAIVCKNDAVLNGIAKKITNVKCSQTHVCWYVPLSGQACQQIKDVFSALFAGIDCSLLKTGLLNNLTPAAVTPRPAVLQVMPATAPLNIASLNNANLGALRQFVGELKLKAYSESTIRTYRNEFMQLLQLLKNKNVNTLDLQTSGGTRCLLWRSRALKKIRRTAG